MRALAEPQVGISADWAGFIEELGQTLDKRDGKVADAAVQAFMDKLRAGLLREV